MGELLKERRKKTAERFAEFQAQLSEAKTLCETEACVYATGSFARGEASDHSDLDLFIVAKGKADGKDRGLSKLNEIIVKADLIQATRELNLPEFSGDGEYLTCHTIKELTGTLGGPKDDVTNTFTARLLLLLESKPLVGEPAYNRFTEDVVIAYWRDYEDHKNDFMPAFLANDILRMWRTFCVNYEARTRTAPASEKAKRRLKNYKLKHSRLLTCYSALLYLAAIYAANRTVSPQDVLKMIAMTPTERIVWMLAEGSVSAAHGKLQRVLDLYEQFLRSTDAPEVELLGRFAESEEKEGVSRFSLPIR